MRRIAIVAETLRDWKYFIYNNDLIPSTNATAINKNGDTYYIYCYSRERIRGYEFHGMECIGLCNDPDLIEAVKVRCRL